MISQESLAAIFSATRLLVPVPVMRDSSLAPQGKTGLIISTLFEYSLVNEIEEQGWYEAFKEFCSREIIDTLDAAIFPKLKDEVIESFASTPLTIEKLTANSEGAITGWAFTNSSIPAINTMTKVAQSVITPIPDVMQAGQWTFSPSGLPMSVLTGKLAADRVIKQLK